MGFNPGKIFKGKNPFKGKGFNPLGEIEKAVGKAKREIKEEVLEEIKEELSKVDDRLEDAAKKVLDEILKAASSKIFKEIIGWIETFRPSSASISIGPITLDIEDPVSRVAVLKRRIDHPPRSAAAMANFIREMAPETVTLSGSVNLALGIGSKELGLGGSLTIPTEAFLKKIEHVL